MIPFSERVNAISINPNMATQDDVARMAATITGMAIALMKVVRYCQYPDGRVDMPDAYAVEVQKAMDFFHK